MLDKLKEMTGGDEARIRIYIDLYKGTLPEHSKTIQRSIDEKNLEELRQAVHSCKTLFSTMGLDELHQMAAEIEAEIKNNPVNMAIYGRAELLNAKMMTTLDQFI